VEIVDWVYLAQDRDQRGVLINTLMNPSGSIKGGRRTSWLSQWQL